MPTPLSLSEAISLLRGAEEESLPVELIGAGQNEQAVFLMGFVSIESETGDAFAVYVPQQLGITVDLRGAQLEYSEPRESPSQHRERAERLLQFMIRVIKQEWEFLLRVWNKLS